MNISRKNPAKGRAAAVKTAAPTASIAEKTTVNDTKTSDETKFLRGAPKEKPVAPVNTLLKEPQKQEAPAVQQSAESAQATAPKTDEAPKTDPIKLRIELKRELQAEEEERKQSRKYTEILEKVSQIKAKSEQLEILEKYGRKLADLVIDNNTQKVFFHIKVNDQEPFETSNPSFVASVLNIAKQQISSKTDEVFQALKEMA